MYRVVMDRERWFSVVMGEQFKVDARHTESLAQRIHFPLLWLRNWPSDLRCARRGDSVEGDEIAARK
jgi:hypothetical protein